MGHLRSFLKKITHPFLKKGLDLYYKKSRPFSYKGIKVLVHPEVFPPQLTLSTQILLDFISEMELSQHTFLELGCGSGIISLFASNKGAQVTASDINETAIAYLKAAAEKNELEVQCVLSNLFENISAPHFDCIIINPPYYPKKAKNVKEQAWYCGPHFEYFQDLFHQLPKYLSEKNKTYMILSEDCDLQKIDEIATQNNVQMEVVQETKKLGEQNFIYRLQLRESPK